MKAKDFIKKLQELDPSGELEILFDADDGYVYDISLSPKLGHAFEGIVYENKEPNCIII